MKLEAATIMAIEIGSLFIFFLLMPLLIVLSRLGRIWRGSTGDGVVLTGVILSTGFLFILLFVAFIALASSGIP